MRDGEASTQVELRAQTEALKKVQQEYDVLKSKLVQVEAMLDAEKTRSSETIADADKLRMQLSCLNQHNKRLVEESHRREYKLQDCRAKLKELEKTFDLEKVIIIHVFFRYLNLYLMLLFHVAHVNCRA